MKAYAGIGSLETPPEIQAVMTRLATALAAENWTLRSGHSPGAEQAFERGAGGEAEVLLPWTGFESRVPLLAAFKLDRATSEAYEIAAKYHRSWRRLSDGAHAVIARTVHLILGPDCSARELAAFVVCWTPNGSLDQDSRGTGVALRLADDYRVEVCNLARPDHLARATRYAARMTASVAP